MARLPHWEYYSDTNHEWRSRIVAGNGNILFQSSESYRNKTDMLEAISDLETAVRAEQGLTRELVTLAAN